MLRSLDNNAENFENSKQIWFNMGEARRFNKLIYGSIYELARYIVATFFTHNFSPEYFAVIPKRWERKIKMIESIYSKHKMDYIHIDYRERSKCYIG